MDVSGINRIYVSVESLSKSLEFYESLVGMQVTGEKELSHEQLSQIWTLPDETRARLCVLRLEAQSTELVLVEFRPHSGTFIRNEIENWDHGIFDLAFVVRDLEERYRRLTDAGYEFLTKPVLYEPTFHPGLKVRYSIVIGPDRVPIPHIQYLQPAPPPLAHAYGKIMDSAQVVEDMDQALAFYHGLLGLKVVAQAEFPAGMLDDLLKLPPRTEGRIALLNREGSDAPLLELLELSVQGKDSSELASAPNIGILMLGFETSELDTLARSIDESPYSIEAESRAFPMPPHGRERKLIVRGPSRVRLEFFERDTSS